MTRCGEAAPGILSVMGMFQQFRYSGYWLGIEITVIISLNASDEH